MKKIKKLDSSVINQIAAGEIVERPASIIKELVENAIDAKANSIAVSIRNGGKSFIEIKDNGHGIVKDQMPIAMERHATSKLEYDLVNIHTFGFRGEALPSIASISRFSIASKVSDDSIGWELSFEGNEKTGENPKPFGLNSGTIIQASDLFFQTPVRLKFLQSDQRETMHCVDIFKKIALSHHRIEFKCFVDEKLKLNYPMAQDLKERVEQVLGKDFLESSQYIDFLDGETKISGYVSLPTFNKAQSTDQYFFVNNRSIKDRSLSSALKIAYGDLIPKDRFPSACIFMTLSPHDVDVNAHPAKTEVRFRDLSAIRGYFIDCVRAGLRQCSQKSAMVFSFPEIKPQSFAPSSFKFATQQYSSPKPKHIEYASSVTQRSLDLAKPINFENVLPLEHEIEACNHLKSIDLGIAKLQLFKTFIISETSETAYVIDQHAAHERIVYEKYKREWAKYQQQILLVPEIIELDETFEIEKCLESLKSLNVVAEALPNNQIMIRSMPVLLKNSNHATLFKDLLELIQEHQNNVETMTDEVLATLACHNSIRAGQILSLDEMNALLREMEITPNIAQCNHGRPTYMKLEHKTLETLFERR